MAFIPVGSLICLTEKALRYGGCSLRVLEDLQPGQKARFYNPHGFTIFRRKTPSYGKTQIGLYLGNNIALFEEMRVSLAGNRGKFEIYIE